jgi:hypothetical protein
MNQSTAWENGARVPVTHHPFEGDQIDLDEEVSDADAGVLLRILVGLLLADTHPALGIECLALVTGIGYEGSSMAEIGRRHHVTRAAVSKRCVELTGALGLPPVRAMRPEENRDACCKARLETLIRECTR